MKQLMYAALALATAVAPAAQAHGHGGDHGGGPGGGHEEHGDYRPEWGGGRHEERHVERRDWGHEEGRREWRRAGPERIVRFDRARPESWRYRPEWRGYAGPRSGYWYAPGYGYYREDPGLHLGWRRGGYVPVTYRRLYVQDWGFYGLRSPPPGYRWVYVDGDFVLMAVATGLILDLVLHGY
jgi:Ni/Co efflux regulator RcnB